MSDIPQQFKNALSTMKDTSYDDANKKHMTQSKVEVFDFDNLKSWYSETAGSHESKLSLKSNDAFYCKGGNLTFIEFKNTDLHGSETKNEIKQKIYDSFVILCDPRTETDKVVENFEGNASYFRDNIDYILVYNESKHNSCKTGKAYTREHLAGKAKIPKFKFLNYFKGYLFKNVYIYTEREFEKHFVASL